jgi:outer membrane protein assembly factor BamB
MLALPESRADVLTYHYDRQRTGLNPAETGLNPVSVLGLTQQWSFQVDGDVYAQPLYVSSIVINGARHNELIVATENDSVYALDADTGSLLWQTSLIPSGEIAVPYTELGLHNLECDDLPGNIGITGTPVIDRNDNKIFAVAYSITSSGQKLYRLHSVNLLTGEDTASLPIAATFPGTFPAVDKTPDGLHVNFNAAEERQRAALLLLNGIVYVAFGGFCDFPPYTGWILAFDENSLALVGALDTNPTAAGLAGPSTLPDGSGGGVWNPGALALSTYNSFIYAVTGNGPWDGKTTFSDSILKLNLKTLSIFDYFTPWDQATDQAGDIDLGSGGPVVFDLEDNAGVPHYLMVVAGKDKNIYVANRNNLGKQVRNPHNGGIYQWLSQVMPREVFGPGAFLNGAMYWGPAQGEVPPNPPNPIKKFVFSNAKLGTTTVTSQVTFPASGTVPATSAFINSAGVVSGGLVWAIALTSPGATLYAFDPGNLNTLFTSPALTPATLGAKFQVPTVANSKVYLGTRGAVYAFAGDATTSNSAVDMTSSIAGWTGSSNPSVQLTPGPIVHGSGGAYSQVVMVTNIGTTPLFTTPLSLVLDNLSPNATLVSASGATTYQMPLASPYQHFALSAPLPPGNSVSLTLQFFNSSSTAPITYTGWNFPNAPVPPRLLDRPGFR